MGRRDENQADIPAAILAESQLDRTSLEVSPQEGYQYRFLSDKRKTQASNQPILRKYRGL